MTDKQPIPTLILPGFYPDPSIVRAKGAYYVVTSSFEYSPGVPIFKSIDMCRWTQIGYCLTSDCQLNLEKAGTSDGIFAPTLRYHQDKFFMITSNRCAGIGNHFFVTAENPQEPWSDPIWIRAMDGSIPPGLDPSLLFDDDGICYFCCVSWDDDGQGIALAKLDKDTGILISPLKIVWRGTGGTFPEGPHIYHVFDRYYIMIAEGGTEYGHKVTIARADDIEGPYESYADNPILTQSRREAQSEQIQGIGHADLAEIEDGSWRMAVHCFRTSVCKLHHLGRETLFLPVEWNIDGWPVVNGMGWVCSQSINGHQSSKNSPIIETDLFHGSIDLKWNYLRHRRKECYVLADDGIGLKGAPETLDSIKRPTWIGRRQQHFDCNVSVCLRYLPLHDNEEAGLCVFQTNEHHYEIVIAQRAGKKVCFLRKRVGDILLIDELHLLEDGDINLNIKADREKYTFHLQTQSDFISLGSGRTQLISTEAMQYQNFTGAYFSLFACGNGKFAESLAWFDQFEYLF